ncbi:hypothetical protein ACM66B_004378 [Microbotryomycetes sp. NB124-2]
MPSTARKASRRGQGPSKSQCPIEASLSKRMHAVEAVTDNDEGTLGPPQTGTNTHPQKGKHSRLSLEAKSGASRTVNEQSEEAKQAMTSNTQPRHSAPAITETRPPVQVDELGKSLESMGFDAETKAAWLAAASVLSPSSETIKLFTNLPKSVKVEHSDTFTARQRGLHLVAAQEIQPGSIFETRALMKVLSRDCLYNRCSHCFKNSEDIRWQSDVDKQRLLEDENGGVKPAWASSSNHLKGQPDHPAVQLQACGHCRVVRYCDAACQRPDWPLHKKECSALVDQAKRAQSSVDKSEEKSQVPLAVIRGCARVLWQRADSGSKQQQSWKEFDAIDTNFDKLDKQQENRVYWTVLHLIPFVGGDLIVNTFKSKRELCEFICRCHSHAHRLVNIAGNVIGIGMAPPVSLIRPSCEPNATVVHSTGRSSNYNMLQVRALRLISPGEELTVDFMETSLPKWARQSYLRDQYFFVNDCACHLCMRTNVGDVDVRERILCVDKECDGYASTPLSQFWPGPQDVKSKKKLSLRCRKCRTEWKVNASKVLKLLDDLEEAKTGDEQAFERIKKTPTLQTFDSMVRSDLIDALSEEKCSLGLATYPMPRSCAVLAHRLFHEDDRRARILQLQSFTIPPTVASGTWARASQAYLLFQLTAGETTEGVISRDTSPNDADDLLEIGFRHARDALSEYELAFGKESNHYQHLLFSIKRFALSVAVLQSIAKGESFVTEFNPYETANKLAAAHGLIFPHLS